MKLISFVKGSKNHTLAYYATQYLTKIKAPRQNTNLFHVREGDCFSTDGHALFVVKDNLGLEPGAYSVLKRNKSQIDLELTDQESPDISRVIPRDKDRWPVAGEFKIGYDNPAIVVASIIRAMKVNTVDQNKLPDFSSANSHYVVKVKDDLNPVVLENETELALVMPMRI